MISSSNEGGGTQKKAVDLSNLTLVGPLPPPSGGMANQTRQLSRLFHASGVRIEVVRTNASYRPEWIGKVRGLRAIARLVPYLFALWRGIGRGQAVHIMANSGWSWHLYVAPAVWIASLRRKPVVLNYRGGEAQQFFERSFRWVEPTLRRVNAIVVPSTFLLEIFRRWNFEPVIVPNIIDLNRFGERARAQQTSAPHVIVTRNLEPIYDIGTALEVFRLILDHFPDATLTVAGIGPEEERLRAQARVLNLLSQTNFVGRIDNDQIPSLYARADLMLNTSLVDNMPISILEALASGVPVVSTDAGGIPHLIDDGVNGCLAPCADVPALAGKAIDVLENSAMRQRLVAAGRRKAEEFGWDRVRERWMDVYHAAILQEQNVAVDLKS